MEITYFIEDGYIGKDRPHTVHIDDDELDECETEADKISLIDDYVQSDFEEKISWYWDHKQLK